MLVLLALVACSVNDNQAAPADDVPVEGVSVPGSTMFSYGPAGGASTIVEVDHDGNITWQLKISDLLGDQAADAGVVPQVMDIQPLASGNVLFSVPDLGIYEVDRDGNIQWSLPDGMASHDIDRLDNGNTLYARTWAAKGQAQVVEVDPDGNEVWAWTGVEAYGDDDRFNSLSDEGAAWMHPTTVQRLADGTTRICARNFNALITVDADGKVVDEYTFRSPVDTELAVTDGKVIGERPHAAEWLADGTFLIGLRSPARVLQIDPVSEEPVVWAWSSPSVKGIRDADQLPGGNTLIASRDRLVEVSPDGAVVWQWEADMSNAAAANGGKVAHAFHAVSRISPDGVILDND